MSYITLKKVKSIPILAKNKGYFKGVLSFNLKFMFRSHKF